MKNRYYSQRRGTNPHSGGIDLNIMKSMVLAVYDRLYGKDYFQEHFGYACVSGDVDGLLGPDISAAILFKLRKERIWPFRDNVLDWDEDDTFDVIEFIYDHVSKPVDGYMHSSYGECGMHYETFDRVLGQQEFRDAVNEFLEDYGDGYQLSPSGEILRRADPGTAPLLEAAIPSEDGAIRSRVEAAVRKYRRHNSTPDDRRDAVRDLADALEYLRPSLNKVLTRKDESDLFHLANKFGIRHHNREQKTDYDGPIWLSWMFYYYLATIHACLRLLEKSNSK